MLIIAISVVVSGKSGTIASVRRFAGDVWISVRYCAKKKFALKFWFYVKESKVLINFS